MERSDLMMNPRSSYFICGMTEFMNLAESTKKRIGDADYIMCPCTHCANTDSRQVEDVE